MAGKQDIVREIVTEASGALALNRLLFAEDGDGFVLALAMHVTDRQLNIGEIALKASVDPARSVPPLPAAA